MDELVKILSEKDHSIVANNPEKSVKALQDRLDLNYLHILFTETNTELGVTLDKDSCDLSTADFDKEKGTIHIEGVLTLNYERVKCIANINIETMEGTGKLVIMEDESKYNQILEAIPKY